MTASPFPLPPSPLLLLGGTFDPPHIGHLLLAECAWHEFGGRVVFLPAGEPWRKTGTAGREVSPAALRLEMTRLAVADNAHFSVDDREVRREGPSYTVDTLAELRAEGHTELVLILGSDALADLPNWKAPERVLELARIAVAENATPPGHGATAGDGRPVRITSMPPLAVSSTLVRERVSAGLPIRYLVPAAVETFIREQRLYRG